MGLQPLHQKAPKQQRWSFPSSRPALPGSGGARGQLWHRPSPGLGAPPVRTHRAGLRSKGVHQGGSWGGRTPGLALTCRHAAFPPPLPLASVPGSGGGMVPAGITRLSIPNPASGASGSAWGKWRGRVRPPMPSRSVSKGSAVARAGLDPDTAGRALTVPVPPHPCAIPRFPAQEQGPSLRPSQTDLCLSLALTGNVPAQLRTSSRTQPGPQCSFPPPNAAGPHPPPRAAHAEGRPGISPSGSPFSLTFGGVSVGRGVEVLLAGVETASRGGAGTCGCKASVTAHGHRHFTVCRTKEQSHGWHRVPSPPPHRLGQPVCYSPAASNAWKKGTELLRQA